MSEESRGGVLGNNTTDILDQEQDHDQEMRPNHNHSSRRYENHIYRNNVPERPAKKILKKKKKSNSGKICSYTGVILVILIIGAFLLVKFQKEIESTGLFNFIPSKPLETRIPQTITPGNNYEPRNDQDPKLKTDEIDNSETNHVQVGNEKDTIETTIPVEQIHNQPKQSITTDLLSSSDTPADLPAQLRNFEISSTPGAQDVEKTSATNKEPEKEVVQVKLPDNPTTKHLLEAIKDDNVPLASALINYGVDLKEFNDKGYNSLHYAASLMNVEIMKLILDSKRIEVEALTENEDLMTALHLVIFKADTFTNFAVDAINLLLDHGADIERKTSDEYTPLLYAIAISEHVGIIKALLERGADINAIFEADEQSALHLAMSKCNKEVIHILLDNHARDDVSNAFLHRPIHEAAFLDCAAGISKLYLYRNNDVDLTIPSKDSSNASHPNAKYITYGATPLHVAVINNNSKAVEELIQLRAKIVFFDNNNKSALEYAERNGYHELVTKLKEAREIEMRRQND